MKLTTRILTLLGTVGLPLLSFNGTIHAEDLSEPVMLVATARLDGTVFKQTVLLAAPTPDGGHIGFIINRPTTVTLERCLPDDAPARKVVDPVYLGGPLSTDSIFAVVRRDSAGENMMPLLPGLFAALDREAVDEVLGQAPNDARYFVGIARWAPNQLATQIRAGAWAVEPVDVNAVFRKTSGLWSELRAKSSTSDDIGTWL